MARDTAGHGGAQTGTRQDSFPPVPLGEPFVPRSRGRVPGVALAGLAVAAALTAGIVLLARRKTPPARRLERARDRAAGWWRAAQDRPARQEARGLWTRVAASAGSAIAGTLARRIAEDVLASAARRRPAEEPVRG